MTNRFLYSTLFAAAIGAWISLPQPAGAAPSAVLEVPAHAQLLQHVDSERRYWRRRHDRRAYVRAPFTSVDVDDDDETHVEAPFTSVHSDHRGTWVRAPFVDIFVPR